MMMNSVVKSSELSQLFCDFNSIIQSDIVNMLCRKRKKDFTRNRNMNFYSVIYYFIFRNKTTTNAELTHFYSSIDKFEKRISKQALNKAIKNSILMFLHILSINLLLFIMLLPFLKNIEIICLSQKMEHTWKSHIMFTI